ncbi:hypothetical protein J3459_016950 [Metarhizium acridum]|nr:hypothetical protein J3459_016950 [Metarhizium acridum]
MALSTISQPNSFNNHVSRKKYQSTEYRILSVAKSVAGGSQILVNNPQEDQAETIQSIRACCRLTTSDSLAAKWEEWRREGVKFKDLFAKTNSYTDFWVSAAKSIQSVGRYATGITQYYSFNAPGTENPPPSKAEDRKTYRHGRIVYGTLKLTSKLCTYFDAAAIALFTILEVGDVKATCIEGAAGDDFFYESLTALIDLLWRRLADEQKEATQGRLPMINPTAFHSLYTGDNYKDTCEKLKVQPFINIPAEYSFEYPAKEILSAMRKRSEHISKCSADHKVTDNSEFLSPDKSKAFILLNAPRLAKHITDEERDNRAKRYEGKQQKNVQLALSVLKGTASQKDLRTASMEVVLIVIDILLDQSPNGPPPKPPPKRNQVTKAKQAAKRMKASEKAVNEKTSSDVSEAQPRLLPLWHSQQDSIGQASGIMNGGSNAYYNTTFHEEQVNTASISMPAAGGISTGLVPGGNIVTDERLPPGDYGDIGGGIMGGPYRPNDDGALFGSFDTSEADTGLPDMDWEDLEGWAQMLSWNESDANIGLPSIY